MRIVIPELPKIVERRHWLNANRKYFLKASEVYATLRTQKGFRAIAPAVFRAALRKALYSGNFNFGSMYLSHPGKHHLPERDVVLNWGHNAYDGCHTTDGKKYLMRYSYDDVGFIAPLMPFRCPACGSDENPLSRWKHNFPIYWKEQQLICLGCWQKWLDFCQRTPIELIEIDDLIKQLNKEITNVTKERRERKREAKELGSQVADGDVRHTRSADVADPCVQ